MGAYLTQPIKDKETEDGSDETGLRWGAAGMQGWRTGMEDSHLACLNLSASGVSKKSAAAGGPKSNNKTVAAFAVFDGHGGAEVAKYCSAHICDVVRATKGFQDGDMELGLRQTFLRVDELLRTPAGQAELFALKKASKGAGSDSDEGEEELVDMDVLSKMNSETHMQIVEQMKRALRDQFRSKGTVQGGVDMDDSDDDEDASSGDDGSGGESAENNPEDSLKEEKSEKAPKGFHTNGSAAISNADGASPRSDKDDHSTASAKPLEKALVTNGVMDHDATLEITQLAPGVEARVDCNNGATETGDAKGSSLEETEEAVARGRARAKEDGEGDAAEAAANDWAEAMLKVEVEGQESSAAVQSLEKQPQRRCGFDCGATAVMGLLVDGKTLVVANAGDSRCVVSRKGMAVDMSIDHKPEDEEELSRIEKAGGAVVDGRVQGNLNLSRAIGDLMYKSDEDLPAEAQMITANPDLKTLEITAEDEFIVLACDGVWNSLSSQETIDFVRERLKGNAGSSPLSAVCADLCDACCAETADGDGTGLDNVTAVIVSLNTAGAAELGGCGVGNRGAFSSSGGEGEGSTEMDSSDDGKRKQDAEDGQGGSKGRSGKQMRSTTGADE